VREETVESSIMFGQSSALKIRQKIKNDLILAIGFMILFAANNTQIRIQVTGRMDTVK
jgi:hypothetical protein